MEVLKIATAGSVDDGKSTLIGRLLYDTKSLTDDKLQAIEKSSKDKGYDYLDFSLATDGLVAEREQGITIDVAHIYFATNNRNYIIADTPGHVEYTRNMVTGASTSKVSIILIDARKGVVEQTNRHFFINQLLQVKHVIVAVNKMDLVDYSEGVYNGIKQDFEDLVARSTFGKQSIHFVPVSALKGDNIVEKSVNTSWYDGEDILSLLESIPTKIETKKTRTRFPVQQVIRPKTSEFHDYRAYAGKLYGGSLNVGDTITVLPSKTESTIKEISFFGDHFGSAEAGASISIQLDHDINVSRGDMIVKSDELPGVDKQLRAYIAWLDAKPLQSGAKFILQHGVHQVLARVEKIEKVVSTDFSGSIFGQKQVKLNEIASVSFKLNKAIYYDAFNENPSNGSFILIDEQSNHTSGVGFIR
mgnify:CR=1 FL=1